MIPRIQSATIAACIIVATALPIVTGSCTPIAQPPTSSGGLAAVLIASGFNRPVDAVPAPGEPNHLFVVEQTGVVRVLDLITNQALDPPFLDIESQVSDGFVGTGEQGLFSIAFHPRYAIDGDSDQGHFFVHYSDINGDTAIDRYRVSANPLVADADSAIRILSVEQPFSNHNGGTIAFGPNNGFLYIALGDGGSANDPGGRAQDTSTLLGKMLRIDVDNATSETPYTIPSGNPFTSEDGQPEIWATGLRNPWRFSFDADTGDLFIADVGQNAREEINFAPANDIGGLNYGWRCIEGTLCTGLTGCDCDDDSLTSPVYEYGHDFAGGFSVTGGFVYRGSSIPDLVGRYLFADFLSTRIWSLRIENGSATDVVEITNDLNPPDVGDDIARISSFAQDAGGELYILDRGVSASNGRIFRIVQE